MCGKKDLQEIRQKAEKHGWVIVYTNGGHLKWTLPNRGFFFSASTPSDWQAIRNIESQIRKVEHGRPL